MWAQCKARDFSHPKASLEEEGKDAQLRNKFRESYLIFPDTTEMVQHVEDYKSGKDENVDLLCSDLLTDRFFFSLFRSLL